MKRKAGGKKLTGIIGKRIVAIDQDKEEDGREGEVWNVRALVLEDGTELVPMTMETEIGEYFHQFVVRKPRKP